jgi:hypothetical protein
MAHDGKMIVFLLFTWRLANVLSEMSQTVRLNTKQGPRRWLGTYLVKGLEIGRNVGETTS